MPVPPDSSNGRAYIWTVSCILFICIVAGGICLAAYLMLPEDEVASWLPVLGVTLVCLPWAFWILTFLYRILSRACGFRVRVGNGGAGGGGGRVGNNNARNLPPNVDVEDGGASQANGDGSAGGHAGAAARGGLQRESSVASNESEMPLAKSMN